MTTHKAIREALEALLVISEWSSDELSVWMVDDPFDTFICGAEDPKEAAFIAACNPAAIRALLADLDAKTAEVERLQALRPVAMTEEQIEAMPIWARFVGLWPETRKDIARAVEAHHHITQKEQGK